MPASATHARVHWESGDGGGDGGGGGRLTVAIGAMRNDNSVRHEAIRKKNTPSQLDFVRRVCLRREKVYCS